MFLKLPITNSSGLHRIQACQLLLLLAICVFAAGCGSDGLPRAGVAGSILVDGQSLKAGVIRFIPMGATKGPAAVATIRDGKYELPTSEGPVVGSNRVEIEAIDYLGFELDDESAYVQQIEKKAQKMPKNPIPENYNRHSTLSVTVRADEENKFDFPITTRSTPTRN